MEDQFKVYEFVGTSMTSVLPISWVKDGKVKYDSKKATEYMKSGRQPYKKWKTYEVTQICDTIFDSYNVAYKAESLLLEQSELDSTDIENVQNPKIILSKKREKKPVTKQLPGETSNSSADESANTSSEISNPPSIPMSSTVMDQAGDQVLIMTDKHCESSQSKNSVSPIVKNYVKDDPITTCNTILDKVTIITDEQITELKGMIENLTTKVEDQNTKIETLIQVVNKIKIEKKKNVGDKALEGSSKGFKEIYNLPLETLQSLEELEEVLKEERVREEFVSS